MTDEQQGWDEVDEPELGEADDDPTSDGGTDTTDEPEDSTAGEVGDPGREA